MKILFIADFFSDDLLGGAESNDSVLIDFLNQKFDLVRMRSSDVDIDKMLSFDFFIVSNFVMLSEECKSFLETKQYIIYEHDHKYVLTRDPSKFIDFKIPDSQIVNKDFYINAKSIFVLSAVCKEIMENSLGISNVINIVTSLW